MTKRFQMFPSLNVFFDMNFLLSIECACVFSCPLLLLLPPLHGNSQEGLIMGKNFDLKFGITKKSFRI